MFNVSVSINRPIKMVWEYFTEPSNWIKWYGGELTSVTPGWQEGAELNWGIGRPSEIKELIAYDTINISSPSMGMTFRFEEQGESASVVQVEVPDPRNGIVYTDGGASAQSEWEKCLRNLKSCIENEPAAESSDSSAQEPAAVSKTPFYKSKKFWKLAIPVALLVFFIVKGYWTLLGMLSFFAIIGFILSTVVCCLSKKKSWKYHLGAIIGSLILFIVSISNSPAAETAKVSQNNTPNVTSNVQNVQPVLPGIPDNVMTSDLLPNKVMGYKTIEKHTGTVPDEFKSATEVSYLVMQPTPDNPYSNSVVQAKVYVVRYGSQPPNVQKDDGIQRGRETITTKPAAGSDPQGTQGESVTSSSCYIRHYLGNVQFEAQLIMREGANPDTVYEQKDSFAPFLAAYMDKVQGIVPSYTKAYVMGASSYYNLKNINETLRIADQGLKVDPQNADLFNLRGLAREARGDNQAAIEDYSKALELDQQQSYYMNRGVAFIYLKEYEKAFQDLNKAIELDSQLKEAYYWRAIAYEEQNKKDDAIANFQQALNIDPNFKAAAEEMKKLQ